MENREVIKVLLPRQPLNAVELANTARFLGWALEGTEAAVYVEVAPADALVKWEFAQVLRKIPDGFHDFVGTVHLPHDNEGGNTVHLYVRRVP